MIHVAIELTGQIPRTRKVIEEGAYLFVDFLESLSREDEWRHLDLHGTLRMDLTPWGQPVVLEFREPIERWRVQQDIRMPAFALTGTVRIVKTVVAPADVQVETDPRRTCVRMTMFRSGRPTVSVLVAEGVIFEVTTFGRPSVTARGILTRIWVDAVPKVPPSMGLNRALRIVGPPIADAPR